MRRVSAVAVCVALVCTGCGVGQALPSSSVMVNGVEREYHTFVPANSPGEPMPLLVAVHGGGGRGFEFPQQDRFEMLAEEEGFAIVLPQSMQLPDNEGEWQLNTGPETRHDIDFIEVMIDDVSNRYAVDSARVYATGYSLGSMFVYELACHASQRFAAMASYAGTMPVTPLSCSPEDHAAIMHVHGADDGIIVYDDTWNWKAWDSVGKMMDIPSLISFWSMQHTCAAMTEESFGSSVHVVHDECTNGVRVEHHRLDDVGHEWPDTIEDESTHRVMWSFLRGFSKS